MSAQKFPDKGFTLIELLIAIIIVAILATIGAIAYDKTQSLARDSKRKQDINELAKAIEVYMLAAKKVPDTVPTASNEDSSTEGAGSNAWPTCPLGIGCLTDAVSSYLKAGKLPLDPLNNRSSCSPTTGGTVTCKYEYSKNMSCRTGYPPTTYCGTYKVAVYAWLENCSDEGEGSLFGFDCNQVAPSDKRYLRLINVSP